ncbi:AfsR/SARP family transcriptional regulator, partial [Streptomyces spiralis]
MAVECRVLGDIAVRVDGRPVELGPPKQRSVLAALLVDAPRTVPTSQLIDRVWGDRVPQRVRGTLYGYVSLLRKALEPAGKDASITRSSGGYALEVDRLAVDLHRFRALVRQARAVEDAGSRAQLFENALELWHGEPCAACDTPWFGTLREGLLRERFAVTLDFNDARLDLGLHGMLLPQLSALAQQDPLDERAAGQLMLALYRSGRSSDALRHYESLRRRLAEELGTDPGPELRRLYHRILTDSPVLAAPAPGSLSSVSSARTTHLQVSQRADSAEAPYATAADRPGDSDDQAPGERDGGDGQQLVPRLLPPAPALFVGRDEELAA